MYHLCENMAKTIHIYQNPSDIKTFSQSGYTQKPQNNDENISVTYRILKKTNELHQVISKTIQNY